MIRYKLYQDKRKGSATKDKWYARAVHETMTFDEFITHLATHHCAFSESAIRGVLIETENCLRELLLEGKAVRLDDLGIFTIGMSTRGEETAEKFTPDSIKNVKMCLYLGRRFRAKQLLVDAKFREADKYIGNGNYYEPTTDDENASSEGNG